MVEKGNTRKNKEKLKRRSTGSKDEMGENRGEKSLRRGNCNMEKIINYVLL